MVRYSVKFNGTLMSTFAPSRDLRQGDPLSPFPFLFIADILYSYKKKSLKVHYLQFRYASEHRMFLIFCSPIIPYCSSRLITSKVELLRRSWLAMRQQ